MGPLEVEHSRPFNSPFECGLRALFVLVASKQTKISLQRLVYYDYAATHLGDVSSQTDKSLHPQLPYRSSEWVARRETLRQGLGLMCHKGLIDVEFIPSGISYTANSLTYYFISHFDSDYATRLRDHSNRVAKVFDGQTEDAIEALMIEHLGQWGVEFIEQINRRLTND